jgi:hypothetical protein
MPDMMKKIAAEAEKIKGVRLLTITRIGGEGMVAPSADAAPATAAGNSGSAMSNAGSVAAKQVATDTTSAAVSQQANKLGVIGSAFGSSMMGAIRHTMAATPSAAPPPDAKDAQTTGGGQTTAGGQTTGSTDVLYEMTTQKGSFSPDPVSAAFFQIPAGYVKVSSPTG